jgi:hypothetical protein
LLALDVTEDVGGTSRDRSRRSIRQRHGQPQLAVDPPEAASFEELVNQRMSRLHDSHLAGQNLAQMLQMLQCVPLSQYLWSSAWSFFAEGDPAAEDWVDAKAREVLAGRASIVAAAIRRKATTLGLDDSARKNADTCADYLLAKSDYLDYPTALAQGWPIATGVIEGACRHVVKDRMDITGARWGLEGAEAVLKLRAIRANDDWEEYWRFHLAEEHKRVHDSRYLDGSIPKAA